MRVASRIIGGVLVFCGLGFLAGFVGLLVSSGGQDAAIWFLAAFFLAASIGLFFAGRYYLRLDVEEPDDEDQEEPPPGRFAPYFAAYRRQLGVLAQVGLALSLIRLVALVSSSDWPRWAVWVLEIGCLSLLFIIPKQSKSMPKWVSRAQASLFGALCLFALVFWWSSWSHRPWRLMENGSHILAAGFIAYLFALEAGCLAYSDKNPPGRASGTAEFG